LRGGINPNSNGTEKEIAQGLQKLSQQLRQAQQGIGQGKPGERGKGQGDETAALSQVERLRRQLEAMASSRGGNGRQQGQNGQSGQGRDGQQGQNGQQSQNGQAGQNGNQQGQARGTGQQAGNGGQQGRPGHQSGQSAQSGGAQSGGSTPQVGSGFGQQTGDWAGQHSGQSGDVRNGGGGYADGTVWGNINTGNNRYGQPGQQRPAPLDASGNPADTERTYQQGMRELNQLRQMVQGDQQAMKEVQELARQMQQLDPSRFPGNPAMVEQMQREMLSSIDRIELQLQRDGASEARTGKPYAVPAGYQDSVAEYYRRLSKNP
jgi:hypothetical protein